MQFFWMLNDALSDSLSRTFQLVIDPSVLSVDAPKLHEGPLWLLIPHGAQWYIHSYFTLEFLERIEDGYDAGNYVYYADKFNSFYCLSELPSSNRYDVSSIIEKHGLRPDTISDLPDRIGEEFREVVDRSAVLSLSSPPNAVTTRLKNTVFSKTGSAESALEILTVAKEQFALGDLTRDARHRDWDEYQNLIYHVLKDDVSGSGDDEIVEVVNSINTLFTVAERNSSPVVNLDFEEIDPENIKTRSFVAPDDELAAERMRNAVVKTERAEKMHQDMLADVSKYLLSRDRGLCPLESNSVDLAIRLNSDFVIFEIKSSTPENFESQGEKALLQLLKYKFALEKRGHKVLGQYLIIEDSNVALTKKYLADFLSRVEIGVLFYRRDRDWPDRVRGLLELCE